MKPDRLLKRYGKNQCNVVGSNRYFYCARRFECWAWFELGKNLWASWVIGYLVEIFSVGATIFYITGFTLLVFRKKWNRFLLPLESAGKMALTSYLMQTLFELLLFYKSIDTIQSCELESVKHDLMFKTDKRAFKKSFSSRYF